MPQIELPIPATDQLILRTVAIGVIQEVMVDRMGLPANTKINFPGYAEGVALPRGLISNKNEDVRYPTTKKLSIEVTESEVNGVLSNVQIKKSDQIPAFLNTELEVELRPIYASMEMRISLHYRAENKSEAQKFHDFMMMKVPAREDVWLHTLVYSYGIPPVFMKILEEIHRLTELQAGYGDDFEEFFNKWVNPRYGMITDKVGKNDYGVFSETQMRVIGFFDYDTVPDFGNRKDDSEAWEIEFGYVIRYDKPRDMYMNYPVTIHNTVLSPKWRGTKGMDRLEDHTTDTPKSLRAIENAAYTNRLSRRNDDPGRYFPLFDEFKPRDIAHATRRIFTSLVLLGNETDPDPLLLMNIGDLEAPAYGMILNDCVKEFIRKNHAYLHLPKQTAVEVSLYMGRLLMDPSYITIDENLNIRSTKPLNKRRYYHIRMSMVTDLTYLTDKASDRLRMSPCMLKNLLEYVTPENTKIPEIIIRNGQVPLDNYNDIANWLINRTVNRQMKTVQNTKLTAVFKPRS